MAAKTQLSLSELAQSGRATISVEEFALLVGISLGSARKAVREGSVPCLRLGARYLLPVPKILQMLGAEHEVES
jgi:excisionase family DNA binding protein